MKYVSRTACSRPDALSGVLKEVDLLSSLEHPFLVNLWYTFQGAFVERGIDTVCTLNIAFYKPHKRPMFSVGSRTTAHTDEEDLFMVSDLLTGGDLRYHLQQEVGIRDDICEMRPKSDNLLEHTLMRITVSFASVDRVRRGERLSADLRAWPGTRIPTAAACSAQVSIQ